MVEIHVNNSTSRIKNLSRDLLAQLRLAYSYLDQASVKHGQYPKRIHAITASGEFGSGLASELAAKITRITPCRIVDHRSPPPDSIIDHKVRFKRSLGGTPYPEQEFISNALYERHRGVGVLPTGTGKSWVIALAINALRVPTLIITPNLNLKTQLYKELAHLFGSQKVGMVSKNAKNKFISIANIQSLNSLPDDQFSDKHFMVTDEVHHSVAASFQEANTRLFSGIYYRLALTATFFRADPAEDMFLRSYSGDVLFEMTSEQAIDRGYIVRPYFKAFNVVYTAQELKALSEAKSYHDMRVMLYNSARSYNSAICRVIQRALADSKPTVVLFDQLEHLNAVKALLASYTSIEPTLVTGLTDDNQKSIEEFNAGSLPLLFGTSCLGEGVNTKPVGCLILAAPGRAKSQFYQNVGRGLRNSTGKTSCDVWIPRVSAHTIFASHFKNRAGFCSEFGKYGEIQWCEV